MCKIAAHSVIGEIKIARCRDDVVSTFGDGQGHDPGCGVAHAIENRIGVIRSEEDLGDASDHSTIPFAGR